MKRRSFFGLLAATLATPFAFLKPKPKWHRVGIVRNNGKDAVYVDGKRHISLTVDGINDYVNFSETPIAFEVGDGTTHTVSQWIKN